MQNSKQENKILTQLEKIYSDSNNLMRSNRIKMISFFAVGIALITLGIYLSDLGVVQGFCDILICISGVFIAFASFYYSSNQTAPLLKEYTSLDTDKISKRITELNQK